MKTAFVEVKFDGEVVLGDSVLTYMRQKKAKSVSLFASVQFSNLDKVKRQLAKIGVRTRITKAKRAHRELQVLGCDIYHNSFKDYILDECDVILYIGDGMFHPKALLLAQAQKKDIKEVVIWDPLGEQMRIITKDDIAEQIDKKKVNIRKFMSAKVVGILVTVKPGQEHLSTAVSLKKKLEKEGKKAYIFIDNTIDYANFENYPFINVWVNTACPRIGTDDIVNLPVPLVNIRDAFDPVKALEEIYSR